jgi:hypothetical protein
VGKEGEKGGSSDVSRESDYERGDTGLGRRREVLCRERLMSLISFFLSIHSSSPKTPQIRKWTPDLLRH